MYLLGGYDGTYWLRDIYSIELGFSSTLYRLSISHDMHAGVLCPMSLVELYAASYANTTKEWNHRLHSSPYQRAQLHGKLIVALLHMCLHADLLNHVVMNRNQTGFLWGNAINVLEEGMISIDTLAGRDRTTTTNSGSCFRMFMWTLQYLSPSYGCRYCRLRAAPPWDRWQVSCGWLRSYRVMCYGIEPVGVSHITLDSLIRR